MVLELAGWGWRLALDWVVWGLQLVLAKAAWAMRWAVRWDQMWDWWLAMERAGWVAV